MLKEFCLKWNNHMNVMKEFKNFLSVGIFVDVTLACDGQSLKAHKIVLSACSSFFRSLFLENPCKHPIVILKDVKYTELKAIIDFMYHGEVNVTEDKLSALIKTAQTLQVKGLGEQLPRNYSSNCESENLSGDKYENQSEDEFSNMSVVTLEAFPDRFSKKRRMTTEDFEPEIKQEVLSDDMDSNASYPSASTKSLFSQSHNSNFIYSQQNQPVGQSNEECSVKEMFHVTTQNPVLRSDSFRQSFESSPQADIEEDENCFDNSSSSISETSILMPPSNLTVDNQKPGTSASSHESLQNKEELENMPNKGSTKNIPSMKPLRKQHRLKKSKVINNNESNSGEDLNEVEDSEDSNSKKKFKCSICPFKTAYVISLIRHRVSVHKERGQFYCKKCSYATSFKSQLLHHIEENHQKEKYHHCNLCTYKTIKTSDLKAHIENVHKEIEPFKCDKCDYHAFEKESLNKHTISVHGKNKVFKCPHCSYRSPRIVSVYGHLAKHKKKK